MHEAGLHPDNIEMHANNRTRWKNQIKVRMEQTREWEKHMTRKHRDNKQKVENITRNMKMNQ